MRLAAALPLLLIPSMANAQTARQGDPLAAAAATSATTLAPAALPDTVPDDEAVPLARFARDGRIPSKNEAYNRARAAEGRLGARLGNDESYRITGN